RFVAVADRRDDDDAVSRRVVDRARLGGRELVVARVLRIAQAAEREVDHSRAEVRRPADRVRLVLDVDLPVGTCDLRDDELRRERDAGDALIVECRGDLAGDERPMALLVREGASPDEAACCIDARPWKLGVRAVEAGVDDRDTYGVERRQGVTERVEGVVLCEVVLPRRKRIRRCVGRPCARDTGQYESEGKCGERRASHDTETSNTGETPGTSPWPGATLARYVPAISWNCASNFPEAPTVAFATVVQVDPCSRWMATVALGSTGRTT